ncbi:MAG: zinc-ribbon domain-containing protein [Gemmatimonadales bacterium]|nr:zinc-ribbon domain-containing protein [Gemmatimonadales bacterium]NIN12732.1 zinc-ribbon domain-containing protein [Gemmatimonadales bacterium]NIQ99623.1 zinc-ribbon domain-containing protein [Gemmatimonadales bacterium]NIS64180.1 zinc-ribbon domain-containing protein [Gemmatimonadales bacterium]
MNSTEQKRFCSSCGAALSAAAQFCHACGTPFSTRKQPRLTGPWILAALAVAVLLVVVGYYVGRSSRPSTAPGAGAPVRAGGAATAIPDISSLSPRQAADSLFNMIMRAHEQGDAARFNLFRPMALQAYQMLPELDNDARYHMGLIHAFSGDAEVAEAQADTIEQAVPGHLLAMLLRSSVAQLRGDTTAVQRAYRRFLDNYQSEIAQGRSEYQDHQGSIEAFRSQAQQALGGTSGSS